MKSKIVRLGNILVKSEGKLYELDQRTFNKIKAIIFEVDSPLCSHCKYAECRGTRKIESSYIKDALTIKDHERCDYVFDCEHYETKQPIYYEHSRPITFITNLKTNSEEESTAKHYGDAYDAHVVHPKIRSIGTFQSRI